MYEAKDILEAVSRIDGGCTFCIENFLEKVPEKLAKELKELLSKDIRYQEIERAERKFSKFSIY